jgi:hypothetical protein
MNKQREWALIESFVNFGPASGLSLVEWDRERPDALVATGNQLVGVEVTAIIEAVPRQQTAPQKWVVEADRIAESARISFEARNDSAVVVRFQMNAAWMPPSRSEASQKANELASLVEGMLAAHGRQQEPITLVNPIPEVSWAYVCATRKEFGGHWAASLGGKVERAAGVDIQATVTRKNPEVAAYRKAAPTVWLLVDCDVVGQGVVLDAPEPDFAVEAEFDRVFCCGFELQWVEVPIRKEIVRATG